MSKQHDRRDPRLTVAELADKLGCSFRGKGDTVIHGVSGLETAKTGQLSFLSSPKYRKLLDKTNASALILLPDERWDKTPAILSDNPYLAFIKAVQIFFSPYRPEQGIHPTAWIAPSARLGRDVAVGALAYIGENACIGDRAVIFPLAAIYPEVEIGPDCVIYSHVSIRENVRLGRRNIIHNGAVIGSDGFGFQKTPEGEYLKIPQKGTVIIEDDVEIGANSAVDRGALDATIIRKGTKIDNLVQVAHNVEIGPNSILAAQTGIAGSSRLGKNVITGGQVGIADHIEVGDEAIAAAKTGITKSIQPGAFVSGSPHLDIKEWRKAWASIPQLYELIREIRRLKKKVEKLESEIEKNKP